MPGFQRPWLRIESLHQDLRNLLLEEAVLERLGLRVFGCAGLIPSGGQANGGGGLEKVREGWGSQFSPVKFRARTLLID